MNPEQAKSSVRWFVSTFGGVLAGYFAAWSGWFSADQIIGAINSPTFLAIASTIVMWVWGLMSHTQTNAVSVVNEIAKDEMSPVKGVITADTAEGHTLAASISGPVVAAGSNAAKELAKSEVTI